MRRTKGPWTIYEGTHVMSGDRLVANTGGYQTNFEDHVTENEANAELIAKAPEMYDQLASARAIMQRFVDKVDSGLARSTETYREMKQWMEAKDETGRTMDTA